MSEEALREVAATLKEILTWSRFAGMQQLRIILSQNLSTDTEMLVYQFSDGSKSTREIASMSGVASNSTVAAYWKKWNRLGIVQPSRKLEGRYQHICTLEEVGLAVPATPSSETSPTPEVGPTNNE